MGGDILRWGLWDWNRCRVQEQTANDALLHHLSFLFIFFDIIIHTQAGSSETTRIDIKRCHQSRLLAAIVDNLKILVFRVAIFRYYDTNSYSAKMEYIDN